MKKRHHQRMSTCKDQMWQVMNRGKSGTQDEIKDEIINKPIESTGHFCIAQHTNIHGNLHKREGLLSAANCEKQIISNEDVRNHENAHKNTFQWRYCENRFKTPYPLTFHEVKLTEEESCFFVDFVRKCSHALEMQGGIHTGDRPSLSCCHCVKRFTAKQHFIRCEITHADDRPFRCSYREHGKCI